VYKPQHCVLKRITLGLSSNHRGKFANAWLDLCPTEIIMKYANASLDKSPAQIIMKYANASLDQCPAEIIMKYANALFDQCPTEIIMLGGSNYVWKQSMRHTELPFFLNYPILH
jgi:hypothetical protein